MNAIRCTPLALTTLLLAPFAALGAEPPERVNSIGMRLVRIQPGNFVMGQEGPPADYQTTRHADSCDQADWDERPAHRVRITAAVLMSATEVTAAQYKQFKSGAKDCGKDDEAAVFVSWHDATAFCDWLSAKEGKRTGMAVIVCPGGGYGGMDWRTHVVYAAQVFNAKGVAVIGLKYRTRPPHQLDNDGIRVIALMDAKRAVRVVRHRAADWDLDPHRVGVAGYSAGADVAMNLAANFEAGDALAADPVERESSRPDFAVGVATWHWRKKESPFAFRKDGPPVFLVHATNDALSGGAPIELPYAIKADLAKLGVPVRMVVFDEGAHGVGNLIPQRVRNGFPPATWPDLLLEWLGGLPAAPRANPESRGAR